MDRVFTNCPGDPGSMPCRVIPKTQKMLLNKFCKVRIKGQGNNQGKVVVS